MLVSVSISLKPQQKHRKNILRVSTSLLCFTVHLTSVNSDSKRLHWVVKQHAGWIGLRLSHFPITHMKHVKPSEMDVESFWGESDTYVWPQTWKESGWRRRRVRNGRKAAPGGLLHQLETDQLESLCSFYQHGGVTQTQLPLSGGKGPAMDQ